MDHVTCVRDSMKRAVSDSAMKLGGLMFGADDPVVVASNYNDRHGQPFIASLAADGVGDQQPRLSGARTDLRGPQCHLGWKGGELRWNFGWPKDLAHDHRPH